MYLGSDAIALAPFTDTVSYLEDGDWVVIAPRQAPRSTTPAARVVRRDVLKSQASVMLVDKGNHRHFMAKEIHEQPEVVGHTLAHYLDMAAERVALPMTLPFDFRALERMSIAACGTAYYAGMVAQILVRALRASAGRGRYRLRVPLPRGAARSGRRWRSSSRSRARPPTRWRRCAMRASTASTCSPSSTCRPRPSRAKATS